MQYYGLTDKGLKRSSNQDAFNISTVGNVLIATVCDGMGGANAGELASSLAIETYTEKLKSYIKNALDFVYMGNVPEMGKPLPKDVFIPFPDFIAKAIDLANAKVFSVAESNEDYEGMGTTITSCIVTPNEIYTANIGDSGTFYISEKKITKLTKDHSLVQNLIDTGKITEDEAIFHPNRNVIMRALGVDEKVEADITSFSFPSGHLLLCSDGLSNYYDDEFFINTLESRHSPKYKANLLCDYAKECGGADNITAVVIKL